MRQAVVASHLHCITVQPHPLFALNCHGFDHPLPHNFIFFFSFPLSKVKSWNHCKKFKSFLMDSYLQAPTCANPTHNLESSLRGPYLTSLAASGQLIFNISRAESEQVAVSQLRHSKDWYTSSSVEHGIDASIKFTKPNASEITLFQINDTDTRKPLVKVAWDDTTRKSIVGSLPNNCPKGSWTSWGRHECC